MGSVLAVLVIWFLFAGIRLRKMSRRYCTICGSRMNRTDRLALCRPCVRKSYAHYLRGGK